MKSQKSRVKKTFPDAFCCKLDKPTNEGYLFIVWPGKIQPRGYEQPAIGIGRTAAEAWNSITITPGKSNPINIPINMKKKNSTVKNPTLKHIVEAAHAAGMGVSFTLNDTQMPRRFKDDHPHVTALLDQSEAMSKKGNDWMNAAVPNPVAAEACMRNGLSFAIGAVWLRFHIMSISKGNAKV